MKFSTTLKLLREKKGISQTALANIIGVSRSTIGMYEAGLREPDFETFEAIADYFNVSMDYLHGKVSNPSDSLALPDNIIPMPVMRRIPLLGTIACGNPILAQENVEGEVDIPEHIHADFALRCKGDSMINARIFDGDIVYIRQQPMVEDGEIAAVLVNDEATLKRVHLYDDHIVLEAENPTCRPITLWEEDMNTVYILGKAVAFTSML